MRKLAFLFLIAYCSIFVSTSSGNWVIAPSISVFEYSPGDSFTVALSISGDGTTIDAMGFDLNFPGALLNFRRAFFEGTLLEPWMFKQTQLLSDGVLRIAGFTTTGQITSGTSGKLVNIVFEVEQSASGQGYIYPDSFIDDLTGASGDSALFRTKSPGYSVSGYIRYYNNLFPIPNVNVVLANFIGSTNAAGEFVFPEISEGDYVIKPDKSSGVGSSISPFDAAKILQYSVGLIELNPYQFIAGDVSGNGSVSPFDAAYILQYSVQLIQSFPAGRDWFFVPFTFALDDTNWNSAPDSILLSLSTDTTGLDFKGIVLGDVTGNWNSSLKKYTAVQLRYQLKSPELISEGKIRIPLVLNFSDETFSGLIKMNYESRDYNFSEAKLTGNNKNLLVKASARAGILNLAFASPYSLKNQPVEIELTFTGKKTTASHYPQIEITSAIIDEASAQLIGENDSQVPASYRLEQNFPNPFNPETTIRFSLANRTDISLQIYNTSGQLIRTLISEKMGAGEHQITWNGLDEKGQLVASGVYFYKLNAGSFQATKKMLFIH